MLCMQVKMYRVHYLNKRVLFLLIVFKNVFYPPVKVLISISLCFLIPKLRLSIFPPVSIAECETTSRWALGFFGEICSTFVVSSDLNCLKYFAAKFKYEFLFVDLSKISFSMVCAREKTGVVGVKSFVLDGLFLSSFRKNVKYSCRVLKGILFTLEFGSTNGCNKGLNEELFRVDWTFGWCATRRPSVDVSARVWFIEVDGFISFGVFVEDA